MPPALRPLVPCGPQLAAEAAGELAERQDWAIGRLQLLALGIGSERIKSWLRSGRLHPTPYRGIYAWGRAELPEKGQLSAGLLFARKGSALDGLSALWWQGLLERRPDLIHIASPGRTASCADLCIRHPLRIERHVHRGLPVVDLARALLVASANLELNSLRLVLARADYDKDIPFSLPSLQKAIRKGPAGSKALRAAMAAHLPQLARCANDFEIDFVLLCESYGIPIPQPNVRKGRFVPDMTWEQAKLIVELDGRDAHRSAAQLASDAWKQEWLESIGYAVIRFTWPEVQFRQDWVAAETRAGLANGA